MSELRVDTITDELGTGSPDFPNGITVSNGVFDTSTITASTIDDGAITGGTIDGATIGGTTAGAGTFTTASADSVTTPLVTNAGTLDLSATGSNIITASTDGAERMRITSDGNVGIGTTAPSQKLTVDGDIRGNVINTDRFTINTTSGPQNVKPVGNNQAWLFIYNDSDNSATTGIAYWSGASTAAPIELSDPFGVFSWDISGGFCRLSGGPRVLRVNCLKIG